MRYLVNHMVLFVLLFVAWTTVHADDEQRLISIDGAITEIVFALNAGEQLLAVDSSSTRPEVVNDLPNVGYMRALSAEPLLALQPDRVIASPAAGPDTVFSQLQAANITVNIIDGDYSPDGLRQRISQVATLLNKEAVGKQLIADINRQLAALTDVMAAPDDTHESPRVLFLMGMQANQWMAAGEGSQADALLGLLHADNVFAGQQGYKPLSFESILELDPDVIVLARPAGDMPLPEGLQVTRAAKNRQLLVADIDRLLGFGPRLPDALYLLAEVVYPEKMQGVTLP